MEQGEFKSQLTKFRDELEQLEAQRAQLEEKIDSLHVVITGLEALAGEETRGVETLADVGFTDAMRVVLRTDFRLGFREPREIRDALMERGFDLSGYTNPLASVHTILKRLVKSGEAEMRRKGARIGYRWKPKYFPRLETPGDSSRG